MTDKYAKLRKDVPQAIEEAKAEGGINHRAQMIADLLADYDRMRDALEKVRPVIAADRQALLDTHGNGIEIPMADELGTLELYEYDGALHVIDAALAQEGS